MAAVAENTLSEDARIVMVDRHVRPADVTRIDVIQAMLDTPREPFFPKAKRALAYAGETVQIADGRYELDPRVFAKMLDALALTGDDLALIVGAGGGYAAAVASHLAASVVALESDPDLAASSAAALEKYEADAVVSATGPLAEGWAEHQPYNAILVYGGAQGALPSALSAQLAEGGRIIAILMDGPIGRCVIGVKSGDIVGYRQAFDAAAPILPGLEQPKSFEF
ncbi:MAG: protein-L-isoaspartate O-methyltransferase [Neomegalonema sp.]|nr:protein-L-isoaspartate O-methyltransferase [Neomegalonema sp.]